MLFIFIISITFNKLNKNKIKQLDDSINKFRGNVLNCHENNSTYAKYNLFSFDFEVKCDLLS